MSSAFSWSCTVTYLSEGEKCISALQMRGSSCIWGLTPNSYTCFLVMLMERSQNLGRIRLGSQLRSMIWPTTSKWLSSKYLPLSWVLRTQVNQDLKETVFPMWSQSHGILWKRPSSKPPRKSQPDLKLSLRFWPRLKSLINFPMNGAGFMILVLAGCKKGLVHVVDISKMELKPISPVDLIWFSECHLSYIWYLI